MTLARIGLLVVLACGFAAADEPVAHKVGETYGIDVVAAKRTFAHELAWITDNTPLASMTHLQAVDGGLRVTGLAQDARFSGFGLRERDLLRSVNMKPVPDVDALRSALGATPLISGACVVEISRDGETMQLMYSYNDSHLPPAAPTADDAQVIAGIHSLGSDRYSITPRLRARFLSDSKWFSAQARFVPTVRDGKAAGFKVYAVRPSSAVAHLGLQSGDVVRSVNGKELTSPDDALALDATLRAAKEVHVVIERGGAPRTLVWVVR